MSTEDLKHFIAEVLDEHRGKSLEEKIVSRMVKGKLRKAPEKLAKKAQEPGGRTAIAKAAEKWGAESPWGYAASVYAAGAGTFKKPKSAEEGSMYEGSTCSECGAMYEGSTCSECGY